MTAGVRGRQTARAGQAVLPGSSSSAGGLAGGRRDGEIVALQRARLLSAAIGLLAERGHGSFSAAALCVRAGVSRRTFYEIFEDSEACLLAILQDTEALVEREIERFDREQERLHRERRDWRENVRRVLWVMLCIAEANPELAAVCAIETQSAGGRVQQARERIVKRLIAAVDQGRAVGTRNATASALTAEALVGATLSIVAARLAETTRTGGAEARAQLDLRSLLGELMGMIVLPYLGPATARRETKRALPSVPDCEGDAAIAAIEGPDPLSGLQMRFTYRTARVLRAVEELRGQRLEASNRLVAERAGVNDPGQISKLLARLQRYGLLENAAVGSRERGEANQWRLTSTGVRVLQSISASQPRKRK